MTDNPNAGLLHFLRDLAKCIKMIHSPSRRAQELEGRSHIAGRYESALQANLTHGRGIVEPAERGLYVTVDWRGDTCNTCPSEIPPHGECYGFRNGTLQCLACGPDRRTP